MLYSLEDIFSQVPSNNFEVVGRLENVVMLQADKSTTTLASLKNRYIGELHSLKDLNTVPVIFTEDGFSPLTSQLLTQRIVVVLRAERKLSSNLEIYLSVTILPHTVFILGTLS